MRLGRRFDGGTRVEVGAAYVRFADPVGERDEIDVLGAECRQAVGGAVGEVDDAHATSLVRAAAISGQCIELSVCRSWESCDGFGDAILNSHSTIRFPSFSWQSTGPPSSLFAHDAPHPDSYESESGVFAHNDTLARSPPHSALAKLHRSKRLPELLPESSSARLGVSVAYKETTGPPYKLLTDLGCIGCR